MPNDESSKQLLQQYEKLLAKRRNFETLWREVSQYIFPRRISSLQIRQPGARQTERLFDSTAIFSNEILSASMQSSLTNQAMKWFSLKLRNDELNQIEDVAAWLDDTTSRMLLSLRQSNLAAEVHEMYLDLGAFGTGAMLIENDPEVGGILCRSLPIGSYVIDENGKGLVDSIIYEVKMSVRSAADRWGDQNFPVALKKIMETNPHEDKTFIHFIIPRVEANRKKLGQKSLPYASIVIEKDSKQKIHEGGYREFPFVVPRWAKSSGEVYGRGPGITALPDIRTLNKAIELELKAWDKAILPPMKAESNSIIGSAKLYAGGLTILRDINGLQPLNVGSHFDVSQLKKEELRQAIKSVFFVDQLLQLMSKDRPQMTATEVQVKVQLLQQILGPTFGRLVNELLNPLIDRVFSIMYRQGKFNLPPPELTQTKLDVEYEGPLAKAQRGQELLAIERVLSATQALVGIDPSVIDILDADQILRETADISGAPIRIIRTQENVQKIRAQKQAQQQQQQQQKQATDAAAAVGKVAPMVKAIGGLTTQRQPDKLNGIDKNQLPV